MDIFMHEECGQNFTEENWEYHTSVQVQHYFQLIHRATNDTLAIQIAAA